MNERAGTSRSRVSRQGILNRWGLGAALDGHLPQVRGRDRLLHLVQGRNPPRPLQAPIHICWGPDLEATVEPSLDGSLRALYTMQWVRPALVSILQACLKPGDLFVDVGANVGVYSTWAARIVGPEGSVIAVEPVPRTRGWLEDICLGNGLTWVTIVPEAVGDEEGFAQMDVTSGASGLSRIVCRADGGLRVSVTTLDRLLATRSPALIKIDVEGHEFSVLQGAAGALARSRAPVVFEAPEFGAGDGTEACVRFLESLGYRVFALTVHGLRAFDPNRCSHNLLAVDRRDEAIEHRLAAARFPRTQNT